MGVAGIDHVNIRTTDPEGSAQFYEQALGLSYRKGPVVMGHQSHWLFDETESAVIHFRDMEPDATGSGAIDHVALRCTDRSGVKERLNALQIRFIEGEPRDGLVQIFIRDPHGVVLELSFSELAQGAC